MYFVTASDRRFQPLLAALLNSYALNGGLGDPWTVIEYEPLDRDFLRAVGPRLEFVPKADLGEVRLPAALADDPRMAACFQKFLVWNLPGDAPHFYVDADVLCLRLLEGIGRHDHLSAAPCMAQIGTPLGAVPGYNRLCHVWNAGIFCFRPSREIFGELLDFCGRYAGPLRHGDQQPHNDYFAVRRPGELKWMGLEWNMPIWCAARHPYLFDLRSTRLLHYANRAKPDADPPNRPEFEALWRLWRRYEVRDRRGKG